MGVGSENEHVSKQASKWVSVNQKKKILISVEDEHDFVSNKNLYLLQENAALQQTLTSRLSVQEEKWQEPFPTEELIILLSHIPVLAIALTETKMKLRQQNA